MTISKETIRKAIDRKLPIIKEKKGFILTIDSIEIENIVKNSMSVKALGNIKISESNAIIKFIQKDKIGSLFSKFFKKDVEKLTNKSMKVSILTQIRPKIEGIYLSFDILQLEVNSVLKQRQLNQYVRQKLEKIQRPIKKLKKIAWFAKVQAVYFDESQNLKLDIKFSSFIILLLLPLFLLREIGLVCIFIYQKFFSSQKNYSCAKGELYQNGTCSSTTKEAFKKYGFIAGMREYYRSRKECKEAYREVKKRHSKNDASSVVDCLLGCEVFSNKSSMSSCDIG